MHRYRNRFHNPFDAKYGPEFYETDIRPIDYKGFKIFQRIQGSVWDCVISGEVIRMMGGLSGAKRYIDRYWDHQMASAPGDEMPEDAAQ